MRDARAAPPILSYDPSRPFDPWLRSVLRRNWIDRQREWGRRESRTSRLHPEEGYLDETFWERLSDLPYTVAELARIAGWGPVIRVENLCLGGQWWRVPEGVWGRWVGEYESARGIVLPRPFPPRESWEWWAAADRMRRWNESFAYPAPGNLSVRWCHHRHLLWELNGQRDELDGPPGR